MTVQSVSADEAMKMLLDGNRRFSSGKPSHPHQDGARRKDLHAGQRPFAAVLTCADSRVPPEILFDAGIGDIFVVRNAGNLADTEATGSVEYAVAHLGVKLVVVLGHTSCGAVNAAMAMRASGGEPEDEDDDHGGEGGCLHECLLEVATAISGAKEPDAASERNARFQTKRMLADSDALAVALKSGLKVAPMMYDIGSGTVRTL